MTNEQTSMTIAEIRERRRTVEQQIAELLHSFVRDTGVQVEEVDLDLEHYVTGKVRIVGVRLVTRL
jgi:hypothetical protein